MFHPSLDEKKKLKIAKLYNTTNMPMKDIADKIGVCLKTAYNHRNYGYETDGDPTSSTISETKKEISQSKKGQWECKNCGYITDHKVNICPGCRRGPFHSFFTKIGSPEHIPYVAPQKEPEKEFCDTTKDFWVCKGCDHISNTEFDICPECGCEEVIFAPDGNEPRNPDDYPDSNDDVSDDEIEANAEHSDLVEEPEKVDQEEVEPEENSEEEFDYECPHCRRKFDYEDIKDWFLSTTYCPHCGKGMEFNED